MPCCGKGRARRPRGSEPHFLAGSGELAGYVIPEKKQRLDSETLAHSRDVHRFKNNACLFLQKVTVAARP